MPFQKGVKHPKEWITKRLAARQKNGTAKHSEEAKQKLRNANLGNKHSEETKKKMSLSHKGVVISEEHKAILRKLHTGKKVSLETRRKISEIQTGSKLSEETKKKMSLSHKKLWQNPKYAKARLKAYAMKPTKPEIQMEALLNELFPKEYKYVGDGDVWIAGKNPDFININGQKKIIEVYGDYWHRNDKEQDRIDVFEPYGYDTLIIWASEIDDGTNYVRNELKKFHKLEHV